MQYALVSKIMEMKLMLFGNVFPSLKLSKSASPGGNLLLLPLYNEVLKINSTGNIPRSAAFRPSTY